MTKNNTQYAATTKSRTATPLTPSEALDRFIQKNHIFTLGTVTYPFTPVTRSTWAQTTTTWQYRFLPGWSVDVTLPDAPDHTEAIHSLFADSRSARQSISKLLGFENLILIEYTRWNKAVGFELGIQTNSGFVGIAVNY